MRAASYDAFGGPITVGAVADPEIGPADALVAVRATGVCRSDWHGWQGHDEDIKSFPHVPGHEFAGEVAAVGADVSRWRPGDRIVAPFVSGCGRCELCRTGDAQVCPTQTQPGFTHWGSFAELIVVHEADFNLVALPQEVEYPAAASLGCRFTTAYRAVALQGRVREGQWVAVFGCGGVGLSAVMLAKALGARVVGIDPSGPARRMATELGAQRVLSPEHAEALRDLPGGGPHVTLDAIGSPEVVASAIECLRPRGRHVQVGLLPEDGALASVRAGLVIARELEILGSHGLAAAAFPALLDLIREERLDPQRLVGECVDLEQGIATLMSMGDAAPVGMTVITEV